MCTSILNTASSHGEAVRWNPSSSNLKQVLLSIQALILVANPMYNMPGLDKAKDTEEGNMLAREYIENVRLYTLQAACLDVLRHPPHGFEEATRAHFRLKVQYCPHRCPPRRVCLGLAFTPASCCDQAAELRAQAHAWLADVTSSTRRAKMQVVVRELKLELEKLQ